MKLAIFDFDGTLFQNETLPFVLKFWGKSNYPKLPLIKVYTKILALFVVHKLKIIPNLDKEKFRALATLSFLKLFEKMTKSQISDFFEKCIQMMKKDFKTEVVIEIKAKKALGYHIVVCSGAYDLLLNHLKSELPIDTILGTKMYFNSWDMIDFEIPLSITTGINKPKALLEVFDKDSIDWQSSYAYGDSYYDYDILSLTGNPIAVTPDARLKNLALENNWEIIN